MADSGTVNFEVIDGNVKLTGAIHWSKSGNNAVFYAKLTKAYSSAKDQGGYKWNGNNVEKMQLGVDGTYTSAVNAAGARTQGASASGSGWRENNDYANAQTESITKPWKSAYALELVCTGNGGKTWTYSLSFAIPLFVNPAGTVYQAEKAYTNIPGVGVKEVAVYANVGGEIKEFI